MTEEQSFEALQKELEDVVARLERGDVAVDDAIALSAAERTSIGPAWSASRGPSFESRSCRRRTRVRDRRQAVRV